MRIVLLLFVVMPILEMTILISVGQRIGAFATIGLVFLTAAIGYALLKQQGAGALQRAREKLARGETPASEITEGIFLAVGGALLLTPGFLTDAFGFLCLMPGLRAVLVTWVLKHAIQARSGQASAASKETNTIEGEFRREK